MDVVWTVLLIAGAGAFGGGAFALVFFFLAEKKFERLVKELDEGQRGEEDQPWPN